MTLEMFPQPRMMKMMKMFSTIWTENSTVSLFTSLSPPLSLPPPLSRKLAGCPSLLDPDDLVRMKEPDWKCVYTYIQEFYRSLVEKGLVKTKKRS